MDSFVFHWNAILVSFVCGSMVDWGHRKGSFTKEKLAGGGSARTESSFGSHSAVLLVGVRSFAYLQ